MPRPDNRVSSARVTIIPAEALNQDPAVVVHGLAVVDPEEAVAVEEDNSFHNIDFTIKK